MMFLEDRRESCKYWWLSARLFFFNIGKLMLISATYSAVAAYMFKAIAVAYSFVTLFPGLCPRQAMETKA